MAQAWRVMSTFATTDKKTGVPKVYNEGDIVKGDDPAVKGREDYFMDVQKWAERQSGVEQATAAPGERRSLARSVTARAQKRTQKRLPAENQTGDEAKPDTSTPRNPGPDDKTSTTTGKVEK